MRASCRGVSALTRAATAASRNGGNHEKTSPVPRAGADAVWGWRRLGSGRSPGGGAEGTAVRPGDHFYRPPLCAVVPTAHTFGFVVFNSPGNEATVSAVISLKGAAPNATYKVKLLQDFEPCFGEAHPNSVLHTNARGNGTVEVSDERFPGATTFFVELFNQAPPHDEYATPEVELDSTARLKARRFDLRAGLRLRPQASLITVRALAVGSPGCQVDRGCSSRNRLGQPSSPLDHALLLSLRQPPARLLAIMALKIFLSARTLICLPKRSRAGLCA